MGVARIGKIRMKNGGAEVRLIRQETPNPDGSNYRGDLVRHARMVAEYDEPGSELVGFIIIGVFSDGSSSTGLRWDNKRSPIPRTLLPAFIAEIVRREAVTSAEAEEVACAVVNRANGFDPGAQ